MPSHPFYVGCFRGRIDADNRIELPPAWDDAERGEEAAWLLMPIELTSDPLLMLLPATSRNLRELAANLDEASTPPGTVAECVRSFHTQAQSQGMDPALVTAIDRQALRTIQLTPAQRTWLQLASDEILVIGLLTKVTLASPEAWARVAADPPNDEFAGILAQLPQDDSEG